LLLLVLWLLLLVLRLLVLRLLLHWSYRDLLVWRIHMDYLELISLLDYDLAGSF
jgi:hypothetical protein